MSRSFESDSRSFEFDAYVIEVHGQTAGIVARDGQAYRFHASAHRFNCLDNRRFATPLQAEKAALALVSPEQRQIRPAPAKRPTITFA